MPRVLTQQDIHQLLALVAQQATGRMELSVVDASNFVSVGERVLQTGVENTYNALSLLIGRTLIASRPYTGKLNIINAIDTGVFSHRLRKISYYSRNPLPAGDWNTQLHTNLGDGLTSGRNENVADPESTKSQWEQRQAVPLEYNFAGSSVWQDGLTRYKYQVQQAFLSEDAFAEFWGGAMQEKMNDMETQRESFRRLTLLNFMGGTYLQGGDRVVNLTAAYNARFGTTYTSAQLRGEHLRSFLEFMTATIKSYSDRMTIRSTAYHYSPAKQDADGNDLVLLRHTPKEKQRLLLYAPLFREAEAMVLPEIFRPNYLEMGQYEGVDFWQSFDPIGRESAGINVVPAIVGANGQQTAGTAVTIPYVVGMLYDEDALMVDFQLTDSETTPMEARKKYMTTWWSFARNAINDFTENSVIFTMQDA